MRRLGWRRMLLLLVGALALVFAIIQAVPYGRDHTNPPVLAAATWDSQTTERLWADACADCHSNLTKWPWYTNVAPFSWLAQNDVDEGRRELNLSELGRTEVEIGEMVEVIREGEMPPWQYTIIHGGARLSDVEKEALISGLTASLGVSGTAVSQAEFGEGDGD